VYRRGIEGVPRRHHLDIVHGLIGSACGDMIAAAAIAARHH
jgi:hypothetical protein